MLTSQELEATYRRYFPMVRGKCQRIIQDEAEAQDLAQEAFTKLWLNRAHLQDPDAVLAWLYRTVTRMAVDRLRRAPPAPLQISEQDAATRSPDDRFIARDLVEQAASRLKPGELEVLILSRVDRLPQSEIAAIMRISERTVRRLLQRAQGRLKRLEEKAL